MAQTAHNLNALAPWQQFLTWIKSMLWAIPLMTSVMFVAGVIWWAYGAELAEREARRTTLIADALSSEAQLRGLLDVEAAALQELAYQLPHIPRTSQALAQQALVEDGLQRLWISVTWLDGNNRIVAQVPLVDKLGASRQRELPDTTGISSHLTREWGGEKLIVRYSPTLLLKRGIPWWLSRKYDVQLVDASQQVMASIDEVPLRMEGIGHETYAVLVGGNMPGAYLELTTRDRTIPFWRTLPVVLVLGFLSLMLVTTALLRRQMRQISMAEAAWRTEAAWRKAMEDSALVGLRARDAHGRILHVNRTFCDLVGMQPEELIGLLPPMPYWPQEDLEQVMSRSNRNLSGHAPREGYEASWRHKDGRIINVMVFESPLVDAKGQQMGWMGSIIDVTSRKLLEERERKQVEAMAHQARLTSLGEVASALAHQLNQPLTAIVGYNAGIQRMLSHASCDVQALLKALKAQAEQANEAGKIVQCIREFLTRRSPQTEKCDAKTIAEQALALLQREIRRQGVQIEWDFPPDLPLVMADMVLIEQVYINLLKNAMDAMGSAPNESRMKISLSAQRSATRYLKLHVDDSGPGLGGRKVDQLCTAFYSTKPDGMGMGLAICRSIIEAHLGGLDACDSPLGGARFSFTLPVVLDETYSPEEGALFDPMTDEAC